ncbi:HflC protein [hydrothermal vent metagenome]|uniref:HflC protein n=1 Tax=hydrothermal vent metagenome TaxID=652676 RepID=A0A3B0ZY65_9ZZZZ
MSPRQMFLVVALFVIGLLVYASFFTVTERELAIKFRLGEIVKADYEPGLYFQLPLVNNVIKYESRILMLDARPTEYLTIEKKKLVVDFYAKWRIDDVSSFYRTMSRGNINTARQRIFNIINNGLKSQFSQYSLTELVSGEKSERGKLFSTLEVTDTDKKTEEIPVLYRKACLKQQGLTLEDVMDSNVDKKIIDIRALVMCMITAQASAEVKKYGISIVDIRIKRIDLTKKIETDVFARMRSEREQFAAEIRASGKEEAEKMRAGADKQRTIVLANAYKTAQKTRGEGDAKAAETYAYAYNKDKEFYSFYRSLDAYKSSFSGDGDILVLEPDSDFFKYFKQTRPKP